MEELEPDTAGIRPKLQTPDEPFRDYVITHEASRGLTGLVNMVGMESPALTSSLSIGRYVTEMVRGLG